MNPLIHNILVPPRRPHRREAAIVPGARHTVPREGRLTLILMDERGRVIHRTTAENSVTNQLRECAATWVRGMDGSGYFGFEGGVNGAHGTNTDNRRMVGSAYPHIYGQFRQFLGSIYLSFSSAAVNPAWWYPLGLAAGADLHANTAFTDNKARGNRTTTVAQRDTNSVLFVADWGLNLGNGFSIESCGLAGLRYPGTDTYDGVWGWMTGSAFAQNNGTTLAAAVTRSHAKVTNSKIWIIGESGSFEIDFSLSTAWNSSAIRSITGPTLATWGSGSNGNLGIAIIGSDFWIADNNTRLRRTAIPTSTALPTVLNTYSPVTGFTDATILGMCSDGTSLFLLGSTKVFVVNPATGAVTSSWVHNGTVASSITYDEVHDIVWIAHRGNTVSYGHDGYGPNNGSYFSAYVGDIAFGGQIAVTGQPYTKTGTVLGYGWQPLFDGNSNSYGDHYIIADSGRLVGVDNGGNQPWTMASGGVLGTRAIVAAPFTKTAANPMRVEYEVTFT